MQALLTRSAAFGIFLAMPLFGWGPHAVAEGQTGVRGFWRVSNLPPGDVLNARGKPSAKSRILGTYELDKLVFVTGKTARNRQTVWYQVNSYGILGWVASSYLQRQKVLNFPNSKTARAGTCVGFEPIWDLTWNEREIGFEEPESRADQGSFVSVLQPRGHGTPDILFFKNPNNGQSFTLILSETQGEGCKLAREQHSKLYGALLLIDQHGSLTAYSGCCNPSPNIIVPLN